MKLYNKLEDIVRRYIAKPLVIGSLVGILACGGESFAQEFYIGPGRSRSVAMDKEGDFVITRDYVAQKFDRNGKRIAEIELNGFEPNISMDKKGNFIIVREDGDGSGSGIFAQRYNKEGNKIGEEFQVNTYTENNQISPVVAMNNRGRFVICWKHWIFDDEPENSFYAQIFDKEGSRVRNEFRVSCYDGSLENPAAIAIRNNGTFVIAWDSRGSPLSSYDVFAQHYDRNGNKLGERLNVNTYLDGSQSHPDIVMDREGNFVIAWYSRLQDGSAGGIYAQRFDKDGNRIRKEFQVNSYTEDNQYGPSIAMDREGNFVIVWESWWQDGDRGGIYAQRFDGGSNKIGGEFQVNSCTEDTQYLPTIAMNNSGDFVVAWTSINSVANSVDTYAKIFPFYNPADLNKDGFVNFKNYAQLTNNWQKTGSGLEGDINKDNKVDYKDLKKLAENWLSIVPLYGGLED